MSETEAKIVRVLGAIAAQLGGLRCNSGGDLPGAYCKCSTCRARIYLRDLNDDADEVLEVYERRR